MAEPNSTALRTLRRSPLAHLEERIRAAGVTGPGAVALAERPFLTMVNVRVTPGTAAAGRLEHALGAPLPSRCGATADAPPHTTLWLGPGEWLVVSTTGPDVLTAALREALAGDPGAVVDVSANRTTLELTGPAAREMLEKGCALDLHPRSFGPGEALSTLVGPVPVVLWQIDDTPSYRLLPRSSYADYLARWLIDAMSERPCPVPL